MYRGEIPERNLYQSLQERFKTGNESAAIFHGIDILKLNLDKTLKVCEKDFVIISATFKYIMVIEVKKTLGPGDSIEKSKQQLLDSMEDLESWYESDGIQNWMYIPMIFTEKIEIPIDCNECKRFIIEGNYINDKAS